MCVLLQRRGSACLSVLVGVQLWEASTRGGCDYVMLHCGCHAVSIYTNINSLEKIFYAFSQNLWQIIVFICNMEHFIERSLQLHNSVSSVFVMVSSCHSAPQPDQITTHISCHVTHCGILFQGRSWSLWAGGDQALGFGKHVSDINGAMLQWCGGHKT